MTEKTSRSNSMSLARILPLIEAAKGDRPPFPRTEIFNETWLVRLVVDWFAQNGAPGFPLNFAPGARWFSEALLPSAFLARYRGDPLAESWTHADEIIGHFAIGSAGRTDCSLTSKVEQFIVVEAKIFSQLSSGVKRAPYFDQAARSVACMAELLKRAGRRPAEVDCLAFYVLAPASQIDAGLFAAAVDKASIGSKVKQRVEAYEGSRAAWHDHWFLPLLEVVKVQQISWESALDHIQCHDPPSAEEIRAFYQECLEYNRPSTKKMGR
jgi:hypothetical protein